jgi:hypothetical protein
LKKAINEEEEALREENLNRKTSFRGPTFIDPRELNLYDDEADKNKTEPVKDLI